VTGAGRDSSYALAQPPQVRVLSATRKGRVTKAQIALAGAVRSVARVAVKLDRRRVATLSGRRSVLNVRLRARTGRKLSAEALSADGRVLASGSRRVRALRAGKRDVGSGGGVGGSVWAD